MRPCPLNCSHPRRGRGKEGVVKRWWVLFETVELKQKELEQLGIESRVLWPSFQWTLIPRIYIFIEKARADFLSDLEGHLNEEGEFVSQSENELSSEELQVLESNVITSIQALESEMRQLMRNNIP